MSLRAISNPEPNPEPKGKMNQEKKTETPGVKTRGQMAKLIREIVGLKLDEKLLLTDMERELREARGRYEARLRRLARLLEEKTGTARVWAEANPGEFGGRRSVEFGHGIAGFRHGPPRLATVARGKWERVLRSLREANWGAPYIRMKEEINKERILADIGAGRLTEGDLRRAGAQVVQEEMFYVEPRLTRTRRPEPARAA